MPKKSVWKKETGTQLVDMTAEEVSEMEARDVAWEAGAAARKLEEIKKVRLRKLQETDYLSNSDLTMSDNIRTWRQSLRDIPQNNTTEEQYDLLLARDGYGVLTHEIWNIP